MGIEAGFDMIELHAAHGYLLSGLITPLQNKRTDAYGGHSANRLRYPLEVFAAMRSEWPPDRPMSVRISATDWADDDGITAEDLISLRKPSRPWALIDPTLSAARPGTDRSPCTARMFQTRSVIVSQRRKAQNHGGRQYF